MRQIGTLPSSEAARKLADYLLTLKIETRLEEQAGGWLVWVCDEDRVPQARAEFSSFTDNPRDERFQGVGRAAQQLRLQEIEADEDYRRQLSEFRERMNEQTPAAHPRYVTLGLILTAALVSSLANFGQPPESELLPYIWISSVGGQLTQIAHGEVWRLVTPIFLHLSILHLFFNGLVVHNFASQIERLQGSVRLLWLVFLLAVFSNLAQFYLGHPYEPQRGFVWSHNSHFGGLSGVAYGLFGYLWIQSYLEPKLGLHLTSTSALIMMGWFVGCLLGFMGPVANGAHAAGLVLGLTLGAGNHLWQKKRN